jgi:hypothetical protein
LSVNVARNRAIEAQDAPQISSGEPREGRIDKEAIAGKMVVFLSNIDLRGYWKNRTPLPSKDK